MDTGQLPINMPPVEDFAEIDLGEIYRVVSLKNEAQVIQDQLFKNTSQGYLISYVLETAGIIIMGKVMKQKTEAEKAAEDFDFDKTKLSPGGNA